MIEQLDSEYIFSEMFKAFDIEQLGKTTQEDLLLTAEASGWKRDQGKL